jgi:hypothetical protein
MSIMVVIPNTFSYEGEIDGYAKHAVFVNGYGASVVSHQYSYGGKDGLFEIAVTHGNGLCYATPVTSDVIGYLDNADVMDVLMNISQLPPTDYCSHKRKEILWND